MANNAGALVTLDMSGSESVDLTLDTWVQLNQDLPSIGATVQAALANPRWKVEIVVTAAV